MRTQMIGDICIAIADEDGPLLKCEADANDVLGDALGTEGDWVVIPVARLHRDMFDLKTRHFGLFLQKFVTYRLSVAILGEIDAPSAPLADFMRETNKGRQVLFVPDLDTLAGRLTAA